MRRVWPSICASLALVTHGLLLPVTAFAQERPRDLGPRSFFPAEYTFEAYADLEAMRDTDLWDLVERSYLAKTAFSRFRKEWGFRIADIRSVRNAGKILADPGDPKGAGREAFVCVFQGSPRLCVPNPAARAGWQFLARTAERIGEFDVVREEPARATPAFPVPRLYLVPRPGCLVTGDDQLIRPVLLGQRRGGVISGELMALTAQRRPLAYVAGSVPLPGTAAFERFRPVDSEWLSEADPLRFYMIRLDYNEADETCKVVFTARFLHGTQGPRLFEDSVKAGLEPLRGTLGYRVMKSYLDKVRWRSEGRDLRGELSLGGWRELQRVFDTTVLSALVGALVSDVVIHEEIVPQVQPVVPGARVQKGVKKDPPGPRPTLEQKK